MDHRRGVGVGDHVDVVHGEGWSTCPWALAWEGMVDF